MEFLLTNPNAYGPYRWFDKDMSTFESIIDDLLGEIGSKSGYLWHKPP